MAQRDDPTFPGEFDEVEEWLRLARPSFSELELDQLKLRAMERGSLRARAGNDRMRGKLMRSRALMLAVTALVIGGTTGGAIAAGGAGGSSNAASAQYRPGNGCGDKNHFHTGPPGNPSNHRCPPQSQGH